jgi:hypothetical protein
MIRPAHRLKTRWSRIREGPVQEEPSSSLPRSSAPAKQNPPPRGERARLAREERARKRLALRSRPAPPPESPRKPVVFAVRWRRRGWVSHQVRLFVQARNAYSLFSKLDGDDGDEYAPIDWVELSVLEARDPRWRVLERES